ncbi:MAG: hypothetical protein H0T11_05320 [Chthoniobacterales bacterium]|nr:hypothetical protein [Chthoniobacterales bacterium]
MDNPEQTPRPATSGDSSEGIIGIGITIGALGVLFLMLGWAQWMRVEHTVAMIFLPIGAVALVVGAVIAMMGQSRKRR